MNYPRPYIDIKSLAIPNKVLLIYGPRQVGKTTLLKEFLGKTGLRFRLDTGDNIKVQHTLGEGDLDQILEYAHGYDLIAIDEAQRIPGIGLALKILVDNRLGLRIIATGSSSFELAGQVGEPLTGRKNTVTLFPMAQCELTSVFNAQEIRGQIPERLIFGSYPAVMKADGKISKAMLLSEMVESYLLKDILELEKVKSSKVLLDLLRLLAFQVGSEVSLSELGQQVGLDYKTVARYLDLFEKSFVLYNLRGFSRNLRNEITQKGKYYFFDNGIRNAVISNFNDIETRNDIGALWENFMFIERMKMRSYKQVLSNIFFWRTWEQKEIDLIEEREGHLFGYEFKWGQKKYRIPKQFKDAYPDATCEVISPENFLKFVV